MVTFLKNFIRKIRRLGMDHNEHLDSNVRMDPWVKEALSNGGRVRFHSNRKISITYQNITKIYKPLDGRK